MRCQPLLWHIDCTVVSPGCSLQGKRKTEEKASMSEGLASKLFNFDDSPRPQEWKQRLMEIMLECREVFPTHEFDFGCSKITHHTIRVTEDTPF